MLLTDVPDYRRADEAELLAALRERDPLALAEAYHRTVAAAHGCARRLLSSPLTVEALLREVYSQMWQSPPEEGPLEGWVRRRCFELGETELRSRNQAPAALSVSELLPGLPNADARYLDSAERALAELDAEQRTAVLLAADRGLPADRREAEPATVATALRALAGPDAEADEAGAAGCDDVPLLADWVLGLLPAAAAAEVAAAVASRPECAAVERTLRRGRRRLEGLPPAPDMGQRILVLVLAASPGRDAATAESEPGSSTTAPIPGDPADVALAGASAATPQGNEATALASGAERTGEPDARHAGDHLGGRTGAEPGEQVADEGAEPPTVEATETRQPAPPAEGGQFLERPPPAQPDATGRGGATALRSALDEQAAVEDSGAAGQPVRRRIGPYADLAALEPPRASGDDDPSAEPALVHDDDFASEPERTRGQRLVSVLLWTLFFIVGGGIGVLLGFAVMPWIFDRFFG